MGTRVTKLIVILYGVVLSFIISFLILRKYIPSNSEREVIVNTECLAVYIPYLIKEMRMIDFTWNPYFQAPNRIDTLIINLLITRIGIKTSYILFLAFAALSIFMVVYYLVSEITKEEKYRVVSSTVASLIYILNPIMSAEIYHLDFVWHIIFIPIFFYICYDSLKKICCGQVRIREIVTRSLIMALSSTPLLDPRFQIQMLIVILTCVFIYFKLSKHYVIKVLSLLVLFFFFRLLLSVFYVYPYIEMLMLIHRLPNIQYVVTYEIVSILSRKANILNTFRLSSIYWYTSPYENLPLNIYSLFNISSLIIPILAFTSLVLRPKDRIVIALVASSLLVSLFSTGLYYSDTIGRVYEYLLFYSPLSSQNWLFRVPWRLLPVNILWYSILSSITISIILKRIKEIHYLLIKRCVCIILIIAVLFSAVLWGYPLIGEPPVLSPDKIPQSYLTLNAWLETETNDFTVLPLNSRPIWGIPKPIISLYKPIRYTPLVPMLIQSLKSGKVHNLGLLLAPLNVKYVLVDVKNALDNEIVKMLLDQSDIILYKNFNTVFVFRNGMSTSKVYTSYPIVALKGIDVYLSLVHYRISNDRISILYIPQDSSLLKFVNASKFLVLKDGSEFTLSYMLLKCSEDECLVLTPYLSTIHHNPAKVWSKALSLDPLHAYWHKYLIRNNIENWEYDYGKGLVFTWAKNATMSMHFKITKSDVYRVIVRYFESHKGGTIKIYLDGKLIAQINTISQLNRFIWRDLGTYRLQAGEHVLNLENVEGFNAVNVFALIPINEYNELVKELEKLLENKAVIYLFEAESDMFREKAKIIKDINASNGEALSIDLDGFAWQNFEIVKEGFYRIAARLVGSAKIIVDNKKFNVSNNRLDYIYSKPIYLAKGMHTIRITPLRKVVALWSFNSSSDVYEWSRYTPERQFGAVQRLVWDGKEKALRIELYNSTWGWKTVRSPFIPVEPGHKYIIEFYVKAINGYGIHLKIFEYDKDRKLLKVIYAKSIGSGSFGWKEVRYIYYPSNSSVAYTQIQVWHGHQTKQPLPNIIWMKNVSLYKYSPLYLDAIWIYSVNSLYSNTTIYDLFKAREKPAEVVSYRRIDPTLWRAEILAKKPFMLVFAEAYDSLWEARVYKDGRLIEKVRSIPVYGVINGFWINTTGNLTIVIRYVPQEWFELGLKISASTFALCILYLVWDWRGGRGDKWALWLEGRFRDVFRSLKKVA